jgi:putative hydrolase of the HAD superfamily
VTRAYDGLLIDVGGVLTTDVFASFDAFCAREGLDVGSFKRMYFESPNARALLHRLEVGEIDHVEAAPHLAQILGLAPERVDDLFPGLYAEVRLVGEVADAVQALHDSGVRTGVLSNSWWFAMYDDPYYERAFDAMVVSGRVHMRKPEPRIFARGIEALGLAAERIVFVDDFEENVEAAADLGLEAVLHEPADPARTVAELERLFEVAPAHG